MLLSPRNAWDWDRFKGSGVGAAPGAGSSTHRGSLRAPRVGCGSWWDAAMEMGLLCRGVPGKAFMRQGKAAGGGLGVGAARGSLIF